MEKYKKSLQNKMSLYAVVLCIGPIFIIIGQNGYLSKFYQAGDFGDFFRGFQLGIYISLALFYIGTIAYIGTLLKDEERLKAHYIKNTDERNIRVSELAGYKLFESLIAPLGIAVIVSGYFSATVFFTLLAVFLFIALVTFARWAYYNKTI